MRFAKNVLVFAFVTVMFCGISIGQILKQVPSGAWVVVKISNLQATNTKVANLAKLLAIDTMQPEMADPLAATMTQVGISQGVDTKGDMAMAIMDMSSGATPDVVILLPVSDYKTFLTNWPDAKTEGDVTTVTMKNDENPSYIVNWGSYAAMSPSKQLLATKPEGMTVSGATAKEMAGKDLVMLANLKVMRPAMLKGMEDLRAKVAPELDKAANQPGMIPPNLVKMIPLLKIAFNQLLDFGKGFATDADAATLSANLSNDGVAMTEMIEFASGSTWGNRIGSIKNTDASLLTGLPQGKYLIFGGSQNNPKVTSELLSSLLDPVVKETATMGEEGQAIADMITAVKAASAAETDGEFGLMAPSGQLGVQPLLQFMAIKHGDAKALSDAQHKVFDAQQSLIKAFAVGGNVPVTNFIASAKTIGGVSFDEYQTPLNAQAQTPMEMQQQMMMRYMFGSDGSVLYSGIVNDKTILNVSGISDDTVTATISALKAGEDPLAKSATVKATAAQLPSQRISAIYIPLDQLFTTGLDYAKANGMDMGVKLPEDLSPIGITVASEGTAVRIDGFMPAQLLQAVTSAGMQIYMNMNNRPNAQPAPGL